ncbi:MAG: cyclase family protein [Clostridiales bacterium]|nr:cyclase family protein [Clostridiales bacterium]
MKLIDISQALNNDTPVYPGDSKLSLVEDKTLKNDGYSSYVLTSCLHTGTHIDVPMHMTGDDRTAADFPVDCFSGRGVLLDVRGEYLIAMRPCFESIVGEGDVVLLHTGFDKWYGKVSYFADRPSVSKELSEFLISRKIKMLGMDMPSPDRPPHDIHKALLESGVILLENLTNLEALQGIGDFEVMALPLKIAAEASFVRAVCMMREEG